MWVTEGEPGSRGQVEKQLRARQGSRRGKESSNDSGKADCRASQVREAGLPHLPVSPGACSNAENRGSQKTRGCTWQVTPHGEVDSSQGLQGLALHNPSRNPLWDLFMYKLSPKSLLTWDVPESIKYHILFSSLLVGFKQL